MLMSASLTSYLSTNPFLEEGLRESKSMAGNDPKTAVVSERTVDTDETTALLAQVANGDSAALSSLYDDYSGLLMSVIVSVLKNKAESEDVLQETFVTIWKKANMYQTHLGKASSWMVTIAKNKAYDRYRKLVRTSDGIESLKEAEVEKVTEVKSSADEALGRCFNLLNEGQKMAIVHHWVHLRHV